MTGKFLRRTTGRLLLISILVASCSDSGYKAVSILETTDMHGVLLPYDFVEQKDLKASLSSSLTYINKVRGEKDITVLLDGGDNLQGQPEVYYYNYIDTISPHLLSEAMNFAGFDAAAAGNHDIEAGHPVYDRLVREFKFPLLAANAVDIKTGEPYFKPWYMIRKKGVRIAVLGLITPSVPEWLPPALYSGMEFRNMVETAKKWMPVMLAEKPDLVVGLFHSGWNADEQEDPSDNEDGSAAVAFNVPGFDIIFTGHDHKVACRKFVNSAGDTILILNAGSRSEKIAEADILLVPGKKSGKWRKTITGQIINSADFDPDIAFIDRFRKQDDTIRSYVGRVIAVAPETVSSRGAYFGPSAFVDLIHKIQLGITGADISFAAPLSFDVRIVKGPVTVGDMFKLYRYENMLYTMSLSGSEIVGYLEYSYGEWFNTMKSPDDFMLKFRMGKDGKPVVSRGKAWLEYPSYNFDSAAGIDYTVDLKKPEGKRITVTGMADGSSFSLESMYKVAVNSYRGSGGGGHLEHGAGLSRDEMRQRLISSTTRDLRYYIMQWVEAKGTIDTASLNEWKLLPGKWVQEAKQREYPMLFGSVK